MCGWASTICARQSVAVHEKGSKDAFSPFVTTFVFNLTPRNHLKYPNDRQRKFSRKFDVFLSCMVGLYLWRDYFLQNKNSHYVYLSYEHNIDPKQSIYRYLRTSYHFFNMIRKGFTIFPNKCSGDRSSSRKLNTTRKRMHMLFSKIAHIDIKKDKAVLWLPAEWTHISWWSDMETYKLKGAEKSQENGTYEYKPLLQKPNIVRSARAPCSGSIVL